MKRLTASLLTLNLLLVSCAFSPPQTSPPTNNTPAPDPMTIPWNDLSIFESGLVASQHSIASEMHDANIYHIDLTIDKNLYEINGTQEVRYTNNENVPLEEIHFRLFPNILGGRMEISNLRVSELTVWPKYELENSVMIVPLAKALNPGESIILHMDFEVTVPQSLELNYGVLAFADDVLALAHAYPMVAVYDDEGWNAEIPPQDGDVSYADASFYIVRVTAPKGLTLVTSGVEIGSSEEKQIQVKTVAGGPARDFYLAASYEYELTSQTIGEVTINSYARKDQTNGSQFALEVAGRAIKTFSERYTPYPYAEFDIVSTPTLALGIEYPGAIAITSRIYDVDNTYRGVPASDYMESTVAHEVGHQWFYNLIGNDQLDDPWLDESLTQFATLQYYEDAYGAAAADGFYHSLEGRWARVENLEIPIGMPVAEYKGAEYGAIVYGRGPLFFKALQEKMGTQAFDAFLHEYAQSLSWGVSNPAVLRSLAESQCDCDLEPLFDEWVYP